LKASSKRGCISIAGSFTNIAIVGTDAGIFKYSHCRDRCRNDKKDEAKGVPIHIQQN